MKPKMNRGRLVLLIPALLLLAVMADAADNSILFTPPESIVTGAGDSLIIHLALDSAVTDVHGYRVKFKFDTTVLHLDTAMITPTWQSGGNSFFRYKDSLEIDGATGDSNYYYDLSSYYLGQNLSIDGYGEIVRIKFTALKSGASFLYFDFTLVQDGMLNIVTDSIKNAWIFVCPLPPDYAFFGDFDKSGRVDIGDLTFLIGYLFIQGPPPAPIVLLGDVNCDGMVDIGDLTKMIDYLFISFSPLCNPCP